MNDTVSSIQTFDDLNLIDPLLQSINSQGFSEPTNVQVKAIPPILQGRDVLVTAQTGSGKTAAFVLPLLQYLNSSKISSNKPQALIMTPTRELAKQISSSISAFATNMNINYTTIIGGVSMKPQITSINEGTDIIIATPGRLVDLIMKEKLEIDHIELFILDEADRMIDMGFQEDINYITGRIPSEAQILFFSATMSYELKQIAQTILKDPDIIEVDRPATTVDTIQSSVFYIEDEDKYSMLLHLLQTQVMEKVLIFLNTRRDVEKVARKLYQEKMSVGYLHGEKDQSYRNMALKHFKKGKIRILVATDVASRGIDIDDISHIINFDVPEYPEDYIHRVGRTGRAGKSGTAITFASKNERHHIRRIEELIEERIPEPRSYRFKSRIPFEED